jgi:hypothetical protein
LNAEHFNPLLEQIAKLEEALYNIQFEQHWLEAQTDRQAIGIISSLLSNHLKFYIFLQVKSFVHTKYGFTRHSC